MSADDIEALIAESGIDDLDRGSSAETIEQALLNLAESFKSKRRIRRLLARSAAIKKLRSIGVCSPARLVDAAFEEIRESSNPRTVGGLLGGALSRSTEARNDT